MRVLLVLISVAFVSACDGLNYEQMEADQIAKMDLTDRQRTLATALLTGYKKEMGSSMLRSRDFYPVECYAKTVTVASRYDEAHRGYLENYTEIDQNYYQWFNRQGIDDDTAYEIGQAVVKTLEECSIGGQLKKRFAN